MVEIPTSLVILQWAILLTLGVLVVVMYRQLAYLVGVSNGLSGRGGLEIQESAPAFDYELALDGGEIRKFIPTGAKTVLLFVNPGCGSCEIALRAFRRAASRRDALALRLLAVVTADDSALVAAQEFRNDEIELARVDAELPAQLYHVYTTPFAYAINDDGVVVARGEVLGERDLVGIIDELVENAGRHDAAR